MANDSSEVRLAPNGRIFIGAVGTPLPNLAQSTLNAGFHECGYIDDSGVTISPNTKLTDVMMWQSAVPVKSTLDTVTFEVKFQMGQVNQHNWEAYFFNENFVNNFGEAKMTLSSAPPSQERAIVIEWEDDETDWTRLVLPKAIIVDRDDLKLVRKSPQLAGVKVRCLDYNGDLAYLLSENPDLVPSS